MASDPETVSDREFAWIDYVTQILEPIVELLEIETRMLRHVKCHDYRGLQIVLEQGPESEFAHAIDQDPCIVAIAAASTWLAALGKELCERAVEGHDHMYRRRESVLAVRLEALPLIMEIEHEGGCIALGFAQCLAPADDKAKPWHTFDALVRRGRHGIAPDLRRIEFQRTESAHRIDQERSAMTFDDLADFDDRIEDAAGCFAVDAEDMRDAVIRFQCALECRDIRRGVFRCFEGDALPAGDFEDLAGALAIGTIDQQQAFALSGHECGEHGLDCERSGALHRDCDVAVLGIHDPGQIAKHFAVDADEVSVTRAPIMDHRRLHGFRRGERSRCQQERIAGFRTAAFNSHCSPCPRTLIGLTLFDASNLRSMCLIYTFNS